MNVSTVKTAVSLDADLYRKATRVARDQKLSRSRLVAKALEAYLLLLENRELLERINASYSGDPDDEDRAFLDAARRQAGKRLTQRDC
jgi:hypothetical protein